MLLPYVLMECLSLSEALAAVLTTESICSLVDKLMTFKPRACYKGLSAALSLADVFAVICMNGLDVLLQMLIFDVVFVAVIVGAFVRS